MLRFDKAIFLPFLLKSILSIKLSNSLWGLDVLLFLEFMNVVFIFVLYLWWIHCIVINFLVVSFAWYKEYMISLISFSKFFDVLPAFTWTRVIGNLWSVFLGVNIFNPFSCVFIGNISFLKTFRINSC